MFRFYQWRLRHHAQKPASSERQRKHPADLSTPPTSQQEKLLPSPAILLPWLSKTLLSVYLCSLPVSWLLAPPLNLSLTLFTSCLHKALELKVCARAKTHHNYLFTVTVGWEVCASVEPHYNKVFLGHSPRIHNVIIYPAIQRAMFPLQVEVSIEQSPSA